VARLSDTTVHDEDASVRPDCLLHLNHLIEEGRLLSMSSRGIYDDNLILVLPKVCHTSFGNLNRICLLLVTVEGALNFSGIHL